MHVAVGSTNPVKLRATEGALADLAGTVVAVDVDPGVPEQPRSTDQTVRGAKNRAKRALDAEGADLGVGLEGGVAEVDGLDGRFLTMWAAVANGETVSVGAGPRLRLPNEIADAIADGRELGPLLDEVLGTDGLKHGRGAVGVFTANRVTREDALRQAVAMALGPVVTEHYG
jgi:inosine/xanthosine triphosphatase